ncbi:iron(III) transport system permease protein [Neomicrococcus aestuarii]|uniref:Iron(III) transport system permease protein n=1 Tax=Neomicrococcus aestuarii TaxID=556325 RepID=A0A7W8TTD7_9MICC|nr:iron ABC transporter permease [Neomicrococcus aestuarii]MBB5512489.1 iron(III) transport system permease protein [Neomicrococcus aestuarii]
MRRHPVLAIGAIVAVVVALIPLGYLIVRTAEFPAVDLFEELLTPRVGRLISTSLLLTALVTTACLVLGVFLAVLVMRTKVWGRKALGVAAALPLAIPSYVAAFGWKSLTDLITTGQTFQGFWAAALVMTLVTYPYVYLPVCAALRDIDPSTEEAGGSLGDSRWRVFRRITLPQAAPAIASGGLLAALYTLSDFGAVSILRVDTFTRAIFTSFNVGFDRLGAISLSTTLLLLTALIFLVEGRFRKTSTRYARLGPGTRRRHGILKLKAWTPLFSLLGWSIPAVAVGGILIALIAWSVQGVSRPGGMEELGTAFLGSALAAGLAAVVTTALALPLGLYITGSRSKVARALERLVYLAHSLPGVVIGLSVVYLGITVVTGLYQTMWLLVLAYAALFLPLALGPIVGSTGMIPESVNESAHSLGSTPLQVFRRVTLPLALPGIASGALTVLLTAVKELPATLMLRPTGFETLATRLWTHTGVNAYAAAAPFAALLVILAILPTWLLVNRVLREDGGERRRRTSRPIAEPDDLATLGATPHDLAEPSTTAKEGSA